MQITRFKTQYLPTTILIVVGVLLWVCMASDAIAWYPATYAESAHGDPISGVNRSTATCENWPGEECVTGSCAHCHDTFDDSTCGVNELMLFAPMNPISQTDNFCFQCHKDAGSVQSGGIPYANDDYGSQFGGGTANSTNIKDAFNFGMPNQTWDDGSSHNIRWLRNWSKDRGWGTWITTNTNGCVVCHPPHYAQKNHDPYTTYKTAIRRPDQGGDYPRNLWGDEYRTDEGWNETCRAWTAKYQSPYHVGKTTYEPDDLGSEPAGGWGSNIPNFTAFCNQCHSSSIPNAKTDANVGIRNLSVVSWGAEKHGNNTGSGTDEGDLIAPYTSQPDSYNYVLLCTDCHEPHGSSNPFLLRTCVNGKDNITVSIASGEPGWNDWDNLALYNFCTACHTVNVQYGNHMALDDTNKYTYSCTSGGCHTH